MEDTVIQLVNADGTPAAYKAVMVFKTEEGEQEYCAAEPVEGGALIFLRCSLVQEGDDTKMNLSDIPDDQEYSRAAACYEKLEKDSLMASAREELLENEDYISAVDENGRNVDFLIHNIFEDSHNGQSYIAVQAVVDGEIHEEISLYRFYYKDEKGTMDMIPSDMEYERARTLFMNLIEGSEQ